METTETLVYSRPQAFSDIQTHYCPGCTHGVAHRLVAEVLDEMGCKGKNHRRCFCWLLGFCL